jgi:hypothetical protein
MLNTKRRAFLSRVLFPAAARPAAVAGLIACWLLGATIGCAQRTNNNVSVAQVAVRANPALELVATDERQAVLTVRVKRTGQILTVRADDVVAGTAFRNLDLTEPSGQAASAGPAQVASAKDTNQAPPVTSPAPAAAAPGAAAPVRSAEPTPAPPRPAPPTGVKAAPPAAVASPAPASTKPSGTDGATIDESRLKPRTEPVHCTGANSVRLDGVLLRADRVAVQAVGQCAVYITNSHIVGRVAVEAAGDTTVTIENSIIEGVVQAAGRSTITTKSSTIQGRVQKLQNGAVRDLGQTIWR